MNFAAFLQASQRGFSVIEVMVALGLTTILGYAMLTLTNNSLLANKHVQLNSERTNLENSIMLVVSDNKLCSQGLKGANGGILTYQGSQTPVSQISVANLVYAKTSTTDLGIRVESMNLIPVSDLGPYVYTQWDTSTNPPTPTVLNYHKYLVQLRVTIDKVDASAAAPTFYGRGKRVTNFNLTLITDPATNRVVECFSQDSAAKACDDMGGIYDSTKNPRCLLQHLGVGYRNAGLSSDPQLRNNPDPRLLIRGKRIAGTGWDSSLLVVADGQGDSLTAGLSFGVVSPTGTLIGGGSLGSGTQNGHFGNNVKAGDLSLATGVGKDLHLVTRTTAGTDPTRFLIRNDGTIYSGDVSAADSIYNLHKGKPGTFAVGFPNGNSVIMGQNIVDETGFAITQNGDHAASLYMHPVLGAVLRAYNGRSLRVQLEPGVNVPNDEIDAITFLSNGNVGLSMDNPQEKLHVNGRSRFDGEMAVNSNLTVNGSITASGQIRVSSDIRLKKNFNPITNALERLLNIKGYTFYWKDENRSQRRDMGLKAQEVEKQFPEIVYTDKDGFKSVSYQALVAPMIEALRELFNDMQNTDERVRKLEEENRHLRQETESIKQTLCTLSPMSPICKTNP